MHSPVSGQMAEPCAGARAGRPAALPGPATRPACQDTTAGTARVALASGALPGLDTEGGLDAASEGDERLEWSEDDIVLLHWRLLQEIRHLADPATPLEEKLDTLRWVFTERDKDGLPFSFVNCLRVVGCSPLSPIAYCGRVDAETVREHIRHAIRPWLHATLARYPDWVRQAVATHPEWVEARLARNPQWINEQIRQMSAQGDLFA